MSRTLISRSPDLQRLREEGYNIEIRFNHLLVHDIPYVTAGRVIRRGTLVMPITQAGNVAAPPDNHVTHFAGEYPCHADGQPIEQIRNNSGSRDLALGVHIDHTFSAKPKPSDRYSDYYEKVTRYVTILSTPAQAIDPAVTAKTFPVVAPEPEDDSVFVYSDTASSRAEIDLVTLKLALVKIAIVGLGGTGSYVLDLVAKTPVREIHLFDQDTLFQHNAFRSPGAATVEELKNRLPKVTYLKNRYSAMRHGIVDHPVNLDATNLAELLGMTFVFLCMEGADKRSIVEHLERAAIPFVDVGMGITETDNSLGGILRVTTSTAENPALQRNRIPLSESDVPNDYARNIQIADLNALNAALAVIKWKKLFGFYRDLKHEHHTTYTIDGNLLLNEDVPS